MQNRGLAKLQNYETRKDLKAMRACILFRFVVFFVALALGRAAPSLAVATFQVDATPPIGSPICLGALPPAKHVVSPLSARGFVLLGAGKPIVMAVVDWGAIANEGMDAWRKALADAADTTVDRVTVHELTLHDAPGFDPTTERILKTRGLQGGLFDEVFSHDTIKRAADALRAAIRKPERVTDIGLSRGKVEQVASSTRVVGLDGKVYTRGGTAWRTPAERDAPEGTIDPYVRLVSFWNGSRPLIALTFYASKSEAYYGKGAIDPGFVGLARAMREVALPGVSHIHFDGAGANVSASKYNDGSPGISEVLAKRLAEGMKLAWDTQVKIPISSRSVSWHTITVALPLPDRLKTKDQSLAKLDDPSVAFVFRSRAARDLAWIQLSAEGRRVGVASLRLGPAHILFAQGELCVEYQLAAAAMKPDAMVAMATYGDSGPGVVCAKIAYSQEKSQEIAYSRTSAEAEDLVLSAFRTLLQGR